jgi:hypothetical protein
MTNSSGSIVIFMLVFDDLGKIAILSVISRNTRLFSCFFRYYRNICSMSSHSHLDYKDFVFVLKKVLLMVAL